jgi:glycosyltransferase involved in cell wall biosynthesis
MIITMNTTLSVIIPTLNEAAMLPGLLDALQKQTRPPDEIIVADAGSKDGTQELAQARGARVAPGGMPSVGRNAGARASTGELLLFLDADVLPEPDFIAEALKEFIESGYDVATCQMEPLTEDLSTRILTEAANLFLQVVQYFAPHAPGFCILVRRHIHEAIGGFDESAKMAEDHDYVQRAAKEGEFGVLTQVRIPVSMRRAEKEGLMKLSLKYLWTELYALAGKPVYSMPFEYQFGAHTRSDAVPVSRRKIIDIGQLREQLGKFDDPLQGLSLAGRDKFERLLNWDSHEAFRQRVRLPLDLDDQDILHRFLLRRLELVRQSKRPLREFLNVFQTEPHQESISLLHSDWLDSQASKPAGPAEKEGEQK